MEESRPDQCRSGGAARTADGRATGGRVLYGVVKVNQLYDTPMGMTAIKQEDRWRRLN